MQRTLLILLALLIGIGAFVALYMVFSERQTSINGSNASTTQVDLHGRSIFTDGEYGFSIIYPETYSVDYVFSPTYHLPAYWRANALPEGTGTPIVALVSYSTKSDNSYPRYFISMIRIGASKDPKELARCEVAAQEQNEQPLPDVTLGDTVFKAFSFSSAGMMQYAKGISYRVLRDGACIAIEQLQTGSSYRDDPASSKDIPDATLQAHYDELDKVIKTFSFARPKG